MRYKLEFTDVQQGKYEVRIFNNNLGNWKELVPDVTPLSIRSTKGELINPILGTGVEIGIMVKDYDTIPQSEYESIFTSPPQTWKTEVLRGDYGDNIDIIDPNGTDYYFKNQHPFKVGDVLSGNNYTLNVTYIGQSLAHPGYSYIRANKTGTGIPAVGDSLKANVKTIFTGYVDTELYNEVYVHPPYPILLTASDGLKRLKDYTPELETFEKVSDIVTKCLLKTGLDLPIWCMNTLTSEDASVVSGTATTIGGLLALQDKSIFSLAQCSSSAFKKPDALSILEGVLKSFNCKIYQRGGEWHIDRIGDLYSRGYDVKEICLNKTLAPKIRLLTPNIVGDVFIGRGQGLEVNSPYGKQSIVGEDRKKENLLPITDDFTDMLIPVTHTDNMDVGKWYIDSYDSPYFNAEVIVDEPDFKDKAVKVIPLEPSAYYLELSKFSIGTKNFISLPFFKRGYKSDVIEISYNIKLDMVDYNAFFNKAGDHPIYVVIPLFISFGNSSTSWLSSKYDTGHSLENFKGTEIGPRPSEANKVFVYRRIQINRDNIKDVLSDTIKIAISDTASDKSDEFGDIKIINSLPEGLQMSVGFSNCFFNNPDGESPYPKYFAMVSNEINNYEIGNFSMDIKERSTYNNTYTGVLEQNYLREADKLEIDLWNPVRIGTSKEIRGLVSSTSRWVNLNKSSNIYNANSTILDEYSGLGLWYTLKELHDNNYSTTDLGHRLPVVLLNSWFNLFSSNQDIITGVLKTNNLLNFDKAYNIVGRPNKQFMMITRNFNCQRCQQKATFHEIKEEEIQVNE